MAIVIGSNVYSGNNLVISNGRVIVDGVDVTASLPDQKQITIEVNGNINSVTADACKKITVSGSVGQIKTQSGDIECGGVEGSISTMSGDVDCLNVGGSIQTMSGNVKHKKA